MSKFIVTYTPHFRKNMIKELLKVDKNVNVLQVVADSILIIDSKLEYDDFLKKITDMSPIFVKHLMPVMKQGLITENFENDKKNIFDSIKNIVVLNKDDRFAVQCRIVSGGSREKLEYSSKDVEVFVGSYYEKNGAVPTFSDSNLKSEEIEVISILIYKNNYYVGFSNSRQNLNFHCDEYRICSKNKREISRAENKLKEALIKFDIQLSGKGHALDIGAAPGGWTKVLVDHGYDVTAVDPGNLKPELEENPKVKHYKCRIEELKFRDFFDIIVNDMNVDPQITSDIMNSLSGTLKENGLAIVTLKLPDRVEEDIEEAKQILSEFYDVLTIKSLFHNRQEVTALIKKKTIVRGLNDESLRPKKV